MTEREVEKYLVAAVKERSGECRKLKWLDRNGAPDRLVMLPGGRLTFVELKATGGGCQPHQKREHARLRHVGQHVEVVDSYARVDEVLNG